MANYQIYAFLNVDHAACRILKRPTTTWFSFAAGRPLMRDISQAEQLVGEARAQEPVALAVEWQFLPYHNAFNAKHRFKRWRYVACE